MYIRYVYKFHGSITIKRIIVVSQPNLEQLLTFANLSLQKKLGINSGHEIFNSAKTENRIYICKGDINVSWFWFDIWCSENVVWPFLAKIFFCESAMITAVNVIRDFDEQRTKKKQNKFTQMLWKKQRIYLTYMYVSFGKIVNLIL